MVDCVRRVWQKVLDNCFYLPIGILVYVLMWMFIYNVKHPELTQFQVWGKFFESLGF